MKITQVRNATLIVAFGGTRFLIDPMLAEKEALPPFPGTPNGHLRNPRVALPFGLDRIADVDAVIVTHTHKDHWDEAAAEALPRTLPILVQHDADAALIRAAGFTDVRLLAETPDFGGVALTKTPGQHGSDEAMARIGDRLGEVCGVVLRHPEERVLYLAGDTVWNAHVADSLAQHAPDVVALNCGEARIEGLGPIIMDADDVLSVAAAAPAAQIVATHMEAVNHAVLTRQSLRETGAANGIADRLHVPEDGETLAF